MLPFFAACRHAFERHVFSLLMLLFQATSAATCQRVASCRYGDAICDAAMSFRARVDIRRPRAAAAAADMPADAASYAPMLWRCLHAMARQFTDMPHCLCCVC